jgi:hypothetical protein
VTTPRHPGSRVVAKPPNLVRIIQQIRREIDRIAQAARPETLTFVDSVASRGTPATAATLTDTHVTRVYRSGDHVFVDVLASCGASSVMAFALAVPTLGLVGSTVTTAAGGDQVMRVLLTMPDTWVRGAAQQVYLRSQRVSGADATTARVVRAWQR